MRDRNGKLFSSGNGEDAGSNPALTQKKQKSKRERMESIDPEKDVWRKQWNEGKERQRWNRSSKASGMRVSEQGMWKKRCKVVIGKQDVGE